MENEDAQLTKEFDNQLEFFPGSLDMFSQVFRNNSVSQIKSFEEVLMRSNPFVESTKPVAKKKRKRGRPRKNERNYPVSNQKQGKNCFISYFNVSKLFLLILS